MANKDDKVKPSQKRRYDAKKKGQVPRSKEAASALAFLAIFFYFANASRYMVETAVDFTHELYKNYLFRELTTNAVLEIVRATSTGVIKLSGPLVGLTLAVVVAGWSIQGGFQINAKRFKLNWGGFNPVKNLGKIFSKKGAMDWVKAIAKVTVMGILTFDVIHSALPSVGMLVGAPPEESLNYAGGVLFSIGFRIAIFSLAIGGLDYLFQRRQFEENLMQTRQEFKEDMKQMEGDRQVKSRIRSQQLALTQQRMMAAVKDADVVVTNPTEYAVALQYDLEKMSAPQVVAKGRGFIARRIKKEAEKYGVPTVENVPLAQALYKSVEVGREIPGELYRTVAGILAYVYKLRQNQWN